MGSTSPGVRSVKVYRKTKKVKKHCFLITGLLLLTTPSIVLKVQKEIMCDYYELRTICISRINLISPLILFLFFELHTTN